MNRFISICMAFIMLLGLFVGTVRAEQQNGASFYDPEDGELTHLELLEKLCTGFPYVGYEKYPEVPQYFQQDYADVPYGGSGYTMATLGCGIVCLAMIASYLTDQECFPEILADQFRSYGSLAGTDYNLFIDAPKVMGFQLEKKTSDWMEVVSALEEGKVVVSVQIGGIFTTTGHFIVLPGITEDGKILVNDPNRKNYQGEERFYDGFLNGFEQKDVYRHSRAYWIYEKKVLRVPGCDRCADPEVYTVPVCVEPHYCVKCSALLDKQAAYQGAIAAVRVKPEM